MVSYVQVRRGEQCFSHQAERMSFVAADEGSSNEEQHGINLNIFNTLLTSTLNNSQSHAIVTATRARSPRRKIKLRRRRRKKSPTQGIEPWSPA